MGAAISREQYEAIKGIFADSESRDKLSSDQLLKLAGAVKDYGQAYDERYSRLRKEGLSDEQIKRVEDAGASTTPNTGQPEKSAINIMTGKAKLTSPLENAGIVEGAKMSVRGTFDLAKDVEVGIAGFYGIDREESRQAWKAATTKWRTEQRMQQMQEFGQLSPELYEMVGTTLPYLFAAPSTAATFTGLLSKRLVQGALIGGSTVQGAERDFADRAWEMTFGASIGVASSVPSILSGTKKHLAKSFTRNFNNESAGSADAIQKEIRRMTKDKSFQFSVAQATGGPFAHAIEMRAAGEATLAAQNNNLNILSRYFFQKAGSLTDEGASPGQIAVKLRNTIKGIHETVSKEAQQEWSASVNQVREKWGDEVVIRGDEYLAKIDKKLLEDANQITNPGKAGVKGLQGYRDTVDLIVNPMEARQNAAGLWSVYDRRTEQFVGQATTDKAARVKAALAQNEDFAGLSAEDTLDVMKGLNKLIGGASVINTKVTPNANKETGRLLMGSFMDSMETNPANKDAVADVQLMREAYKKRMEYLQSVDDTMISRVFAGRKLPVDPAKRLDALLKQEPEDLAATRDLLAEYNPVLLDELQRTHMARIHGGALNGTNPKELTQVDLDKFLTRLEGSMEGAGAAGKGLHSPQDQHEILMAAKALRIIKNKYFKNVIPGDGSMIENASINIVSRSPEFMARFLTRVVVTGKGLEAGMLDQTFREAMQVMSTAELGSRPMKDAMVFLIMWTNQAQLEEQADATEAQRQLDERANTNRITKSVAGSNAL